MPPVVDIVDRLVHGKLSTDQYPLMRELGSIEPDRTQEILIFFLGGSTLAEASFLRRYNQLVPGASILLVGTELLNGAKLIEQFSRAWEK